MQITQKKFSSFYHIFIWTVLVLFCSASINSFAEIKKPLDADKAFVLTYSVKNSHEIQANWKIAPGYFLYREHMKVATVPATKMTVSYPKASIKHGSHNKQYEIYTGDLSVPILLNTDNQKIQLSVDYQGCSDRGFCYPPTHKNLTVDLTNANPPPNATNGAPTISTLLKDQNQVESLLFSQHFAVILAIFMGIGLLLAFTPCVFPMIPILTSIIVGQKETTTQKSFFLSLTYVLGSAMTYAGAGLLAASMGGSLQVWLQKPWVIGFAGGLFVLLALSLFGLYELRLPNRFQNMVMGISNKQQGGTYAGVFFMGVISTLIVSPCVTAPLVGILLYISQTGDLMLGASALFAMGLGMGIPLLIIGMSAGKWLPKSGAWMDAVKKGFGILMLGMAIWLTARVLPQNIVTMLWGALLIGVALFLGAYLPRLIGSYTILNRGLGIVVGCTGLIFMLSGFGVMPNPVNKWINNQQTNVPDAHSFVVVQNLADFNEKLAMARAEGKPAILDFYADWCESCISMDRYVFNTSQVQKSMSEYVLLRVDLTANTAADEALLKYFDVIAPPTILFFDASGHEENSHRIVGEVDANEFVSRLSSLRH